MAFTDYRKKKKPIKGAAPALSKFSPKPQERDVPRAAPPTSDLKAGAPKQQEGQQERVSTTRDRSGNVTSYISEVGGKKQTFSPEQWKKLIEVRKTGGTKTGDPKVLARYQEEQGRKQREQITGEVLAQQERERITQEVTPEREIQEFVTPELPGGATSALIPEEERIFPGERVEGEPGGVSREFAKKRLLYTQASIGLVKAIPLVGGFIHKGLQTTNYEDWVNFDKTKQLAGESVSEIDQIITDIMEGNENDSGAAIRFERAKGMLSTAINNNQQLIQENPVFFEKEGEELAFELEEIRLSLVNRAREINRVLSFPGEGRRATTRETGLPQ